MTRCILRLSILVGLLATGLKTPALAVEEDEKGFVPLFDGKSLDGWRRVGGTSPYRLEGDSIVGEVDPASRANTFLRTEKTYGDFILKLDVKLDLPSNSGIQFRSHERVEKNGSIRVYGYQCEIDPSDRAWTGGIYDEASRGWLFPLSGHPEAQKAFKKDDWNSFVIEARGPALKTWVNGIPCADLLDTQELEGLIALQVHVAKQGRIRWKNIRLKDLGQSSWTPLWDGKTLDGWDKIGGGTWTIDEGAIHGTMPASESRHGHLITRDAVRDVAIRLKFKAIKGNSGLYFRVEEGGSAGVKGFQAEIDPANDVGGLYETEGRAWVVRPKPDDVKKWLKPEDWNVLSVVAQGNRVVVQLNGHQTAEVRDDPGRSQGRLALQLHGGQEMDVWFKDIEYMKLDKPR
jgi:hypothetical protein